MKQIRKRLTYANVMSSIAVFLVLGGASAFAATQLGKNTVGTKQLKKNAVTAAKVKKNAINAAKIRNGSVTEAKLADDAVSTGKLANNAVNAGKLANNAVTTGKLAEGAVGTGKLADAAVNSGKLAENSVNSSKIAEGSVNSSKLVEAERSQAYVATGSNEIDLPNKYAIFNEHATVLSLNVPGGNWLLNAQVSVAVGAAESRHVLCRLLQGSTVIAQGGFEAKNVGLIPSLNNVHLSGLATAAGTVSVTCGDTGSGVGAVGRNLIATRVGSVSG